MCPQCDSLSLSRRGLFVAAGALVAAAALPNLAALGAEPAATSGLSPDEALRRLEEGIARYAANISTNKDYSAGRAARALGQAPFAAILSCSDSRVAPELAFDQGPGELFVVRVAGNFVNEDGLASLEYGVAILGVPLILVLGHSSCGAIEATIKAVKDGVALPGHLPSLVNAIRPSIEEAMATSPPDLLAAATIDNVRDNVAYLQSVQPILPARVAAGTLKIAGGIYDIPTGKVTLV
jgi:carbonic anhydrase